MDCQNVIYALIGAFVFTQTLRFLTIGCAFRNLSESIDNLVNELRK